ncbi:hypothetical protein P3L10_021277 [Capsicum annuum]
MPNSMRSLVVLIILLAAVSDERNIRGVHGIGIQSCWIELRGPKICEIAFRDGCFRYCAKETGRTIISGKCIAKKDGSRACRCKYYCSSKPANLPISNP